MLARVKLQQKKFFNVKKKQKVQFKNFILKKKKRKKTQTYFSTCMFKLSFYNFIINQKSDYEEKKIIFKNNFKRTNTFLFEGTTLFFVVQLNYVENHLFIKLRVELYNRQCDQRNMLFFFFFQNSFFKQSRKVQNRCAKNENNFVS